MTDARLPDRWLMDARFSSLTGDQFRSYCYGLMWCVSNRLDGRISPAQLAMIPMFRAGDEIALVNAELWRHTPAGFAIVDFEATQTSAAVLASAERQRVQARDRQARKRARDRDASGDEHGDVTRDVPRDSVGQARQGQDRPGQAEIPDPTDAVFAELSPDLDTWLYRERVRNELRRGLSIAEARAGVERFAQHQRKRVA